MEVGIHILQAFERMLLPVLLQPSANQLQKLRFTGKLRRRVLDQPVIIHQIQEAVIADLLLRLNRSGKSNHLRCAEKKVLLRPDQCQIIQAAPEPLPKLPAIRCRILQQAVAGLRKFMNFLHTVIDAPAVFSQKQDERAAHLLFMPVPAQKRKALQRLLIVLFQKALRRPECPVQHFRQILCIRIEVPFAHKSRRKTTARIIGAVRPLFIVIPINVR